MGDYILADWPHLTSGYPEYITADTNKHCLPIYGEYNSMRAGLGMWCGAEMQYWQEKAVFPWLPKMLYCCYAFVAKPKRVKCWKKWIHYCWLELKQTAMLRKKYWRYISTTHLWVLKTFDGKFMVWVDEDDIGKDVNKESLRQYSWSSKDSRYIPYKPVERNALEVLMSLEAVVRGAC